MKELLEQYPGLEEQLVLLGQVWIMFKLVFGAMNCFMGYKLMRLWMSLGGFVLGAAVGFTAAWRFLPGGWPFWAAGLGGGLVAGALAYQIYLVGAFLLGWLLTVSVTLSLVRPMQIHDKWKLMLLAAGAFLGLLVGVLIVAFARPVIIILTGISGAASVASCLGTLFSWEAVLVAAVTAAFAAGGILAQFLTAPPGKHA